MKFLRPILMILLATFALTAQAVPSAEEVGTIFPGWGTDVPAKFTDLFLPALDVGCGSEGDVCAVGTNGHLYCLNFVESKWELIPLNEEITDIIAVDVDDDGRIYIVTKCSTFYLDCHDKWVRLPGSGKDIGVGVNFDVWKIGNDIEKPESKNYGVWKLFCEKECDCICSRICLRFRRHSFNICDPIVKRKCHWFRAEVYGYAIDVHPNGNAAVLNSDGYVYIVQASDFSTYRLEGKPSGTPVDITYGNNGVLYITLDNGQIHKYNEEKKEFKKISETLLKAVRICGTAYDHLFFTTRNPDSLYTSTRFA